MTCVATKINRDKTSALREYMHVRNDHELKYYVKHSYFLFTRLQYINQLLLFLTHTIIEYKRFQMYDNNNR